MIAGNDIFKIREYLENNKMIEKDELLKVYPQKQGDEFPLSVHVAGMVFAMLSAQTVWANIERSRNEIVNLFFDFDVEKIKSQDYMYFYDGLGKLKARGRLTKSQMKELHHNISVMEKICKKYGSMDKFLTSKPITKIIKDLSSYKSEYKLKRMAEALVCEYLKYVGIDCFKMDVHLTRMLGSNRLAASPKEKPSFDDLLPVMQQLSKETGLLMWQIDYILWAYCATKKGEICTENPKCNQCVVRDLCKKKV